MAAICPPKSHPNLKYSDVWMNKIHMLHKVHTKKIVVWVGGVRHALDQGIYYQCCNEETT
jgi:hypothetical protein